MLTKRTERLDVNTLLNVGKVSRRGMTDKLLMGNEAFAYAALSAGVRVVAGYPGTPSSEVVETVAALCAAGAAKGVHVEWSTNEKAALELLAGASLGGARTLFTCKQVGLNVASDALMSLNYVGIKGGMVLFVADDPGPISSQTEQDTRRFAKFAKVPLFDPATIEQGFEMMLAAFDLSEKYGTPVIVRSSTRICHSSTFLDVAEKTVALEALGFERSSRWVIFPRRAYEAHGEINVRLADIAHEYSQGEIAVFNPSWERASQLQENQADSQILKESRMLTPRSHEESSQAAKIGIVAGGVSTSYVREALREIESIAAQKEVVLPNYRLMQIGTPYPFPEKLVTSFVEGLETILVFEELDHVIEDELQELCGRIHGAFEVYGKKSGHTQNRGENSIEATLATLIDFFEKGELLSNKSSDSREDATLVEVEGPPSIPFRAPVLCAGCPHRGSFYAVKQALKKEKLQGIFCGDIGCYTLGNALPLDAVDTCLCMGAGITMAQGLSVVEKNKKQLAFIGDSTFFASGLTGLVNAVYNNHDITVVVLDNSTTAMTGSQPHPGTGDTLMGRHNKPISIEKVLRAIGFECITKANPFNLEESTNAAREAISFEGCSAILYEAPCITLVKPGSAVTINGDLCTGCKRCIKEIGCPAIAFDKMGNVAFINGDLCTGCELCLSVCPFEAIASVKGEGC